MTSPEFGTRVQLPEGTTEELRTLITDQQAKLVATFNAQALAYVGGLTRDDRQTARRRWFWTVVISAALVVLSFVLAVIALLVRSDAGAVAAAAVIVAVVVIAGFANPLQTIERDVVFRRWSDMIVGSYYLEVASQDITPEAMRQAAADASAQFAVLAAAHGKAAAGTADAITAILGGKAGAAPAAPAPTSKPAPTTTATATPEPAPAPATPPAGAARRAAARGRG
jgi:hypothetical protein